MVSSIISEQTNRLLSSSQAISTKTIHKDYVKVIPLTIDATPLNYNSFLPDRRQNYCLNSTLVQQENLNGTRNLTQQDIQTPSHFINKEIVETIVTTTQQSISPKHSFLQRQNKRLQYYRK